MRDEQAPVADLRCLGVPAADSPVAGTVADWLGLLSVSLRRITLMGDQHSPRMLISQSLIALAPGATYELRFDEIGDLFPPGMVGDGIHPKALTDLCAFAEVAGCTATKDNGRKAFVFLKRN
jgi:hypothetical protein